MIKDRKVIFRLARKARVRKKIKGTKERPRLTIFKSNRYIYIQIIDDEIGNTLVEANSLELKNKGQTEKGKGIKAVEELGKILGRRALEKGIKSLVLDRNGYKYHGVVKTITDAMRSAGVNV